MLCAVIIIGGYSIYEAHDLIYGAPIQIQMPTDGETFSTQIITVAGTAKHIEHVALNGRPVLTDDDGQFSETLVLGEGINIVTVQFRDRFNRLLTKELHVVYKPDHTLTTNQPVK